MENLDARINELFRLKDRLNAAGDGGTFVDGKGWIGVTDEYKSVLAELLKLTRQRLSDCGLTANTLKG